jgi:hypothetical protein
MVLIEFLFAGKNTEDQEFRSSEKYGCQSSLCSNCCFRSWWYLYAGFWVTVIGLIPI